ncbi:MAG: radical SAM protein [Synergistaceae bacterium]|nr:radical SAM protein [Synergistaceae bacterium]
MSKSLGLKNLITTNGSMLKFQPEEIYSLVDALNISIPSFNPDEYKRLTRSEQSLSDIVDNAVKACSRGLRGKINMVYTKQDSGTISDIATKLLEQGIVINDMIASEEYYREFLKFAEKFRNDSRIEIESARNPGLTMCTDCRITHPTGCPSCRSIWVYPDRRITLCPFDGSKGNGSIFERIEGLMKS